MSASTHVVTRSQPQADRRSHQLLAGLHPEPRVRRDLVALLVLGIVSAIVCGATSGWIAVMAAIAALATPIMGKVPLTFPRP